MPGLGVVDPQQVSGTPKLFVRRAHYLLEKKPASESAAVRVSRDYGSVVM
jgi:hypothetical protein